MMSSVKCMAGGSKKLAVVGMDVGKRALVHSAAWTSDSLSVPKPWHAIGSEHAKIFKARDTTWHPTGGAPARSVVGPAQQRWASGAAGVQGLAVRRYAARTCARFMSTTITREKLRNIAVIAHVDHGKTTLVDKVMEQCGESKSMERFMDNLDLEKERGITIMAKCTSLFWKDTKINVVDTPGHADFGGEVERVMSMIDGVLLLVDAAEGPMAQTKFVLAKALKRGIRPIVVINKVDKDTSRVNEVESEVFDLFAFLDATEEQLNFPVIYASGRNGWADLRMDGPRKDMTALLDTIVAHVPHPQGNVEMPFSMSTVMLGSDTFLGRLLTGCVATGSVKINDPVIALNRAGEKVDTGRVTKILTRQGDKGVVSMDTAVTGDIIQLAGLSKATVADTICSPEVTTPLPTQSIDPPTVCMTFGPNDSPLQGQEGKKLTSQVIWDRLVKEAETNVSIIVKKGTDSDAHFEVFGRGELQLGILVENMRREGFELQISPPQVVYRDEGGKKLEPVEEVTIEVEDVYMGAVVNKLNARKGIVQEMRASNDPGRSRIRMIVPTRGLLGYRSVFFTDTRGTGLLTRLYLEHQPFLGPIDNMRKGVLVNTGSGKTTEYAMNALEARGVFFVAARTDAYNGMIVGEHSQDFDLDCNPCNQKHVSNVRTSGKDEFIQLRPPRKFNLEEAMAYIQDDEMLEVTPTALRMRKKELDTNKRARAAREKQSMKKNS